MSGVSQVLVAAVYTMAALLIGVGVNVVGGASGGAALLAGIVVLLIGGLGHEVALRILSARRSERMAKALGERLDRTEEAIDSLDGRVADLIERDSGGRERQGDLRELKRLVEQLAAKLDAGHKPARPAKAMVAGGGEPANAAVAETPAAAPVRMGPARLPPMPVPPPPPEPDPFLADTAVVDEAWSDEDRRLLERIRESLAARRTDVLVQPIVRLPQRRVEYFEAFSRLRAADGSPILPEAYDAVADRAGLGPAIGELLLARSADLVRRDLERRSGFPYICRVTPDLANGSYFRRFVDYMRSNAQLSHGLVPAFAQADFDLDNRDFVALAAGLARDGYRLAIDRVESLDLDFRELARRNVRFLKVDPELLIGDAEGDDGRLHDILEHAGIALVAERVDSETLLLELLDCPVDFGQGYLFGGLRKSF